MTFKKFLGSYFESSVIIYDLIHLSMEYTLQFPELWALIAIETLFWNLVESFSQILPFVHSAIHFL